MNIERMDSYTRPDFSQSALLSIDMQNDFVQESSPFRVPGTEEIVPHIEVLLAFYRKKNWPIIHVIRLYEPDGKNADLCRRGQLEKGDAIVIPGSLGAELVPALRPDGYSKMPEKALQQGTFFSMGPAEWMMYKPRWGAFYQTDLDQFLKSRGVNTLVFTGCNFPNCPRTSIYEASERDFKVTAVADAISGMEKAGRKELENIGVYVCETASLLKMLGEGFTL